MANGRRRVEYQPGIRDRVRSASVPKDGASNVKLEELKKIVPIRSDTEKAGPITILLADDHPLVREGLSALISQRDDMRVVTQAASGRDAIEQYFVHRPDIALLDLRMPVMDGIAVLNVIYERDPACRVVIMTSYDNEEEIYRALLARAKGYILKDAPVEELMQCVRTVCNNGRWIPPLIGAKLARRIGDQDLTSREVDVLRALVLGKSNKEIGVILEISEATVKVHVTHILKKLGVTGRTEAISVALKRGLIRLDDSSVAHC
jgi:DNA-binding NarL/FixJ family response regulator